ncbi:MAG: restriction endonuclease subunit S [Azonexus sp.]
MSHARPHLSYKETKIPWLSKIPTHWNCLPLLAVADECDDKNTGLKENNLLSLSYGRIVKKDINSDQGLLPESFETYQIIEQDDIVFRMTDLQNDQRSLRSAISHERGIITSAYIAVRPRGINASFMSYLMRAYDVTKVFYAMGGGMRQSLKFEDLRRLQILVPPPEEQKDICEFLDRETARIDRLVTKKTKFLELLKEKRRAVVTRAVTKGIVSTVKMRDSGDKWLGEVPEHWLVAPIKVFVNCLDGCRIPLTAEERGEMQGGYPYYGASGVIDSLNRYIFDEDLVLVSEDGANLTYRTYPIAFVAKGKYWVNNHAHVVKPHDQCDLFWAERIDAIDLIPYISGATQPKLTIESMMNIRIAVPPSIEERIEISKYIEGQSMRIAGLLKKTERSIELLREHRSALIAAAVTGKIDVKGAV